jgi:SAM-dependent methyltransferase
MIYASKTTADSNVAARLLHAFRCEYANLSACWWQFAYATYYRFVFGKKVPFAHAWGQKIACLERQQRRGDIPLAQEAWEALHRTGQWRFLHRLDELTRYSLIVGYIQFLKPGGCVLDVGCGEGILLEKLSSIVSRYVGVDISQTAFQQAAKKADVRSCFVQAAAQDYVPTESFDAIIFNEVLYYFEQPLELVQRHESWLRSDGIFITSLYQKSARANAIRRRLKRRYKTIDEVSISRKSEVWTINVFAPKAGSANKKHSRRKNAIERRYTL